MKPIQCLSLTLTPEGIIINNKKAIQDLIFDKNKPKHVKINASKNSSKP